MHLLSSLSLVSQAIGTLSRPVLRVSADLQFTPQWLSGLTGALPSVTACETSAECDAHATCVYAPWVDRSVCICDQDYFREDGKCVPMDQPFEPVPGQHDGNVSCDQRSFTWP